LTSVLPLENRIARSAERCGFEKQFGFKANEQGEDPPPDPVPQLSAFRSELEASDCWEYVDHRG
jgi:hypothetical protein